MPSSYNFFYKDSRKRAGAGYILWFFVGQPMRYAYSLFLYLLTPFILLRLWWKGRQVPAYRQRIVERFGWGMSPGTNFDIWIHAVSLGEVIAASPLIDELLGRNKRLIITTMTPTGAAQVSKRFADNVVHRYIPYDLPGAMRRFFKSYKPCIGIIMETEIWPNLINQAARFSIPLLLVNARLSPRSFKSYEKIRFLLKPILNQYHTIIAQSADDATRFIKLGADAARVLVFGNIKFDLQTQNIDESLALSLKQAWGSERIVVIAASTHDNEEEQLFSTLGILQQHLSGVILLIAPRHPERFQLVYNLSRQAGFNTGLRSQPKTLGMDNDVVILDSLGELPGFYKISDYAFVGGSLVPVGGHNVLEPIAMGTPVLTGKHTHNFKTICRDLEQAHAIEVVENSEDLMRKIINLQSDLARRTNLVAHATRVLDDNKGALLRYVEKIEAILVEKKSSY